MLPGWQACKRCPRHHRRLGVAASRWPSQTMIVVVGRVAPREAQALGGGRLSQVGSIEAMQLAARIRACFDLDERQVVVDHLVACGVGRSPTAADVAGCSERFEAQNVESVAALVLVGEGIDELAAVAGVDEEGLYRSGRGDTQILYHREWQDTVAKLAALLERPRPALSPSARPSMSKAERLRSIVGAHEGVGKKHPGRDWSRTTAERVTQSLVEAHLRGDVVVAPFRSVGFWRWVVLDVDRHNPVQEFYFADTLAELRKRFPRSLFVQSSRSGGVHVYVRVPQKTFYSDAARWLRAYLALEGVSHRDLPAEGLKLRAEVVEVPLQPPRLPFGVGSFLLDHDQLSIDQQLEVLVRFIKTAPPTDFIAARAAMWKARKVSVAVTDATRRSLDVIADEGAVGRRLENPRLNKGAPWKPVTKHLSKGARHVVGSGIPAVGTRLTWTLRLIKELRDVVDEATAQQLLHEWILNRDHQSGDIATDVEHVLKQTDELIAGEYQNDVGVPTRVWEEVDALITRDHLRLKEAPGRYFPQLSQPADINLVEAKATAFMILKKYFRQGRAARTISSDEFGQFCGRKLAHDVQNFLENPRTWLIYRRQHIATLFCREYELTDHAWPAVPGEPVLTLPPFTLPRRRWIP